MKQDVCEEKIKEEQTADRRTRILSVVVILVLLFTVWYMMDLVFLTFILTFVFYHLLEVIQKHLCVKLPFHMPNTLILAALYFLFIGFLVFAASEFIPRLAVWTTDIAVQIKDFDAAAFRDALSPRLAAAVGIFDFDSLFARVGAMLLSKIGEWSAAIGALTFNLVISLLLSFLIVQEKDIVAEFGRRVGSSRISFFYEYFILFGRNFCQAFGNVMRVQITIACVNSVLSGVALRIIGFESVFPIMVMIFLLGMIPVAGVIISLFPLCVMSFNLGGLVKVIEVCAMVLILHAVEAYILNPKLMSAKTKLPVCFVFIILLVGEHYMGVWGLLMGVPIFIFLMNIFEVDYAILPNKKVRKEKREPSEV